MVVTKELFSLGKTKDNTMEPRITTNSNTDKHTHTHRHTDTHSRLMSVKRFTVRLLRWSTFWYYHDSVAVIYLK